MQLTDYLASLTEEVETAEQAKEAAAPVVAVHRALTSLVKSLEVEPEAAALVASALGERFIDLGNIAATASDLAKVTGALTGSDRTAGDMAAKALGAAVDFNLDLPDGVTEEGIAALLGRWSATAPKGGSGRGQSSGSSKWKALGFTVRVKCDECGCSVASTGTDNLNSLRDAMRPHDNEKHKGEIGTRGEAKFVELSTALREAIESKGDAVGILGHYSVTRES